MKLIRKKFKYAQEIAKLPFGEHSDSNTPGLFLLKRESGRHSWSYLYRVNGKQKRFTLGRLDKISLREARETVHKSSDPVAAKKSLRLEENKKISFGRLAEKYVEEHSKKFREWKKTKTALRHKRFKSWNRRLVTEIEKHDVKTLLAGIPGNGLANQTRALLHSIFNFAIEEDILTTINPVSQIKRRPSFSRTRVLNDEEIRAAWSVPLFKVMLLTLQRPTNVSHIRRSEISGNQWLIPASKFKTKIDHLVPLVDTALETLSEIPNPTGSDNYFTPADCRDTVKRLSDLEIPSAKPKDLQRSGRSRLSSITSPDTAERILGHRMPGIRAVYDRCDYFEAKLKALKLWEKELLRIVNEYDRFLMDPNLEMTIHPFVKK